MIRYVYIGDQICEHNRDFAFFDTIPDRFIDVDGQHVFTSIEDFIDVSSNAQFERMFAIIPTKGPMAPYQTEKECDQAYLDSL